MSYVYTSASGVSRIRPDLWLVWWDDANHTDRMIRRRYFSYVRLENDGKFRVYFDRMEQSSEDQSRLAPTHYPVPADSTVLRWIAAATMQVLITQLSHPEAYTAAMLGDEITPMTAVPTRADREALARAALAEASPEEARELAELFDVEDE